MFNFQTLPEIRFWSLNLERGPWLHVSSFIFGILYFLFLVFYFSAEADFGRRNGKDWRNDRKERELAARGKSVTILIIADLPRVLKIYEKNSLLLRHRFEQASRRQRKRRKLPVEHLEKSGCKKMKRDSTIPRVFALERDEIINLVFASLGVVSSSHLKLDRLLANIFEKKQHKLLSSMMKGNTLLGETRRAQPPLKDSPLRSLLRRRFTVKCEIISCALAGSLIHLRLGRTQSLLLSTHKDQRI